MMSNKARIERLLEHLHSINRHVRSGTLVKGEQQITRVQWMILRHVRSREECTIGHLVKHFGVQFSTISQMLDRLEKSQLVYRTSDDKDARVKIVRLTEEGKTLFREIESVWLERLTPTFEQFSDEEQRLLVDLLGRLDEALSED